MPKKTVTALSTRTVVLIITGLAAAGALAYAGISMDRQTQITKDCMNSCLEYQTTDPQYVGVCQQSCKTGEVIVYSNADLENAAENNPDATATDNTAPADNSAATGGDTTATDQPAQ